MGIAAKALNYVGAEVVATALAPGVHHRGEVSQRVDIIETAHRHPAEQHITYVRTTPNDGEIAAIRSGVGWLVVVHRAELVANLGAVVLQMEYVL